MHSKMLLIVQDESIDIRKVLALASLCIPLGACITLAACLATLWRSNLEEADANVHVTAVVMQGKVCCLTMPFNVLFVWAFQLEPCLHSLM